MPQCCTGAPKDQLFLRTRHRGKVQRGNRRFIKKGKRISSFPHQHQKGKRRLWAGNKWRKKVHPGAVSERSRTKKNRNKKSACALNASTEGSQKTHTEKGRGGTKSVEFFNRKRGGCSRLGGGRKNSGDDSRGAAISTRPHLVNHGIEKKEGTWG